MEIRQVAIEKGLEKRRLAIERKEQSRQAKNKVENEMKVEQYKKEEMEWNEMYTVGPPIIIVGAIALGGGDSIFCVIVLSFLFTLLLLLVLLLVFVFVLVLVFVFVLLFVLVLVLLLVTLLVLLTVWLILESVV